MTRADLFSFGPYLLDARARRITRGGADVALSPRLFDVLRLFVSRPNELLSTDDILKAVWPDTQVEEQNVTQAIHALRRALPMPSGEPCIRNESRRGYLFAAGVTLVKRRERDEDLDAVLATHQAFLEGRAALETLNVDAIAHARTVFGDVVQRAPDEAWAHVGLTNACALQFEMTRATACRDTASLAVAVEHAREAVRLDAKYGEAWATLGFVLERVGQRDKAIAAARQATTIEPDNWRHQLRLSAASWGEERLRAARRTLRLVPRLAMAHWLAATVLVARQTLDDAEQELRCGMTTETGQHEPRFSAVGVHWLRGLLALARGDDREAASAFEAELDADARGHLYAREVAANTWYGIAAMHLRRGGHQRARQAFKEALTLLPAHPFANAALGRTEFADGLSPLDAAIGRAVALAGAGKPIDRTTIDGVFVALTNADGNGGWLLPIEPMLNVAADRAPWAAVLDRLRTRAT